MIKPDIKLKTKQLIKDKEQLIIQQAAIYRKIAVINKKITNIQKKCKHPNIIENHVLGDYYQKSYTNYFCPDCKATNQ